MLEPKRSTVQALQQHDLQRSAAARQELKEDGEEVQLLTLPGARLGLMRRQLAVLLQLQHTVRKRKQEQSV